jgi:lipopolysaccharide biosynthesis glycosyltransferase
MKNEVVAIVVCGDKNVEIGLHVTLFSLLRFSSSAFHKIYFINEEYTSFDIDKLNTTLLQFKKKYEILSVPYKNNNVFEKCRSLHGNRLAYIKLLLPNFIEEKKVIYLDLDIIVNLDIMQLYNQSLNGCIIAAVVECTIGQSIENRLYKTVGFEMNSPYFNSGIMLIDCETWKKNNITEKCLEFANKYPNKLQAADQSVLNYYFYNNFLPLPNKFNILISNRILNEFFFTQEGIFHFYGRPKPWDLFAEIIHPQYKFYKKILRDTFFSDYKSYENITKKTINKMFLTYRSYIKMSLKL